jgi:hypothetical protein
MSQMYPAGKYPPNVKKTCGRCNTPKLLTFFGRDRSAKDGLMSLCKLCRNEEAREWKRTHPESVKASKKKYNQSGKASEMWRKQRLRRLDKIKVYQDKYREANREKIRTQDRSKKLMDKFGITLEEYDRMLQEQNGTCALCKQPEIAAYKNTGRVKALAVHHWHSTGVLECLLCQKCNIIIGQGKEDPAFLRLVADWLEVKLSRTSKVAKGELNGNGDHVPHRGVLQAG